MIAKILSVGLLGLAAWATAQPVQTWGRYLDVTVNTTASGGGANVRDTVSEFPLLLRLNATNAAAVLAEASPGGADVRVADASGNAIPFEIEQWSSTAAALWVRVPRIAGNSNANKVRLYWGKAGAASASRDSAVFNASNVYEAVFHLNENAGDTARDATPARFKGVPVGTAPANLTGSAAVIGNAKAFGGVLSTTDLTTGGAFRLETSTGGRTNNSFDYVGVNAAFTISTWVRVNALPATGAFGRRRGIVTKANAAGGDANDPAPLQWAMRPNAADRVLNFARMSVPAGGTAPWSVRPDSLTTRWTYVTYVANGAGTDDNLFRAYNELDIDTTVIPDEDGIHGDVDAFIGGFASAEAQKSAGQQYLNGVLDEVRISKVSRKAAWVDLEFQTQRPNVTAVTYGSAQTNDTSKVFLYPVRAAEYVLGQAVSLTPFVKAGTTINASGYALLSGTLPAGVSFSTGTGVISGTPTATAAASTLILTATAGSVTHRDTITFAVTAGDPPGAPGTPTAAYVAGGNVSATVTWTAPASSGSTAITGYKVIAVQDTSKSCAVNALTCTITGLNATTSYSFRVRAINAAGGGALSAASNLLVPPTVPGAPTSVTGSRLTNTSAAVSWLAAPNGGSPITGYKAYLVQDTTKACQWTSGELTCTITGLNVASAIFQVRAFNAIGAGPLSANSPAIPVGLAAGSFVVRVSGSKNAFAFRLAESAVGATDRVKMTITNASGRTVWSKSSTPSRDGLELTWNGKASNGHAVSSGLYVVKISLLTGGGEMEFAEKAVSLKP
jgi:hypothetical protein